MEFFNEVTALAALAVVAVQQLLKLNFIPIVFANRYPVLTNVLLSLGASVYVTWQNMVNLVTPQDWILHVASVSLLAAITYNMTLRNSASVQRLSSKGSSNPLEVEQY